jgi:hypothetical protein
MSNAARIIYVESDSELGQMLDEVVERDVLFEKEGVRYRVSRIGAPSEASGARRRPSRLAPERVLDIIGIGEAPGGSNIARHKDQYLADAADHRE